MKDFNILSYVGSSLWAITPEKWGEMLPALIRHARGDKLNSDELQAFLEARTSAPVRQGGKNVAVIPIMGTIAHRMSSLDESSGGTSTAKINHLIDQAAADESIGTIVYHFDTPGGTVVGLQETADRMFALRESGKKQIAFVEGQCCSAGYWLASQADSITAVQHSHVGSIGVFSAHQDVSEMLKKEGITINLIKAGKFKVENNPFEPLSDDGRAQMQARVDQAYGSFVDTVARGRGVSADDVRNGYGEGRALSSKDAKKAGLIDKIDTFEGVLSKALGRSAGTVKAEEEQPVIEAAVPPPVTIDPAEGIRERLSYGTTSKA